MSKPDISLETRASAAYVQGRLVEVVDRHRQCSLGGCSLLEDIQQIVTEWRIAEAELKVRNVNLDRCNDGGCRYGD